MKSLFFSTNIFLIAGSSNHAIADVLAATSIEKKTGEILLKFSHPPFLGSYIMEKGSIALDGISLTVFNCKDNSFNVSIIPFTWTHTNLNTRKIGDLINIECDMIGKYVYKACENIINSRASGSV